MKTGCEHPVFFFSAALGSALDEFGRGGTRRCQLEAEVHGKLDLPLVLMRPGRFMVARSAIFVVDSRQEDETQIVH